MDTVTKTKISIPKFRTFAHDLDVNRDIKHLPASKKDLADETKVKTTSSSQEDISQEHQQKVPTVTHIATSPKIEKSSTKKIPTIQTFQTAKATAHKDGVNTSKEVTVTHKKVESPIVTKKPVPDSLTSITNTKKAVKSVAGKKVAHNTSYDATVITEMKHKRFHLVTEIKNSLHDWWEKQLKRRAESKKPKYTIPLAERRKGVIQKATSTTGRTTNSDHDSVLERIRANKKTNSKLSHDASGDAAEYLAPVNSTTKKKSTWIDPKDEVEEMKKPKTKIIVPVIPELPIATINDDTPDVPSSTDTPPVEMEDVEVNGIDDFEMTTAESIELPPVPVIPEPIRIMPEIITPQIQTETSKESGSTGEKNTVEETARTISKPRKKSDALSRLTKLLRQIQPIQNPNKLVLTTLTFLTLGFIIYVGINSLTSSGTSNLSEVSYTPAQFNASVQYHEVPADANKTAVFAQLQEKNNPDHSVTEVVFLTAVDSNEIAASTLLPLLGFNLAPDFVSSLDHIAFGYYRSNPWLMISTNNQTTAQGGMLQWEINISTDLDPWFGATVHTTKTSGLTNFKDEIINSIDVRVLTDNSGKERITYGFVSPNHILITTNTTAWLNLANNFKHP